MSIPNLTSLARKLSGISRGRARGIVLFSIFLVACASPGDPERVEVHARAFKGTAADATNILLYMVKGLQVQTRETEAVRRTVDLMRGDPKTQGLQGFMSLAPELIGWSESLRRTHPIREELRASLTKSLSRSTEVNAAVSELAVGLSQDSAKLGNSIRKFKEANIKLKETVTTLSAFASAMTAYLDTADDLEASANAMLRELNILSHNQTLQNDAATLARLNRFSDEMVANTKKIDKALENERASKDAGLESLLICFKTLDSLPGLSPDLSQELKKAIKLIEDVQNGVGFSPNEG